MARRAYALQTLLAQIDALYPNRNKASDGWIADAKHASTSQHQPNARGIVTAQDFTHDPANGVHGGDLAEWFNDDPRTWYVIWNRSIWDAKWIPYNGPNPHDRHVHISTKQDSGNYDNATKWNIGGKMRTLIPPHIVREHYINYTGHDPGANSPALNNRYEDPIDDEFWFGLVPMLNQIRQARDKQINDLRVALANEQAKPPKEVIKEVEKIVEKIVEVPVEVKVGEEE